MLVDGAVVLVAADEGAVVSVAAAAGAVVSVAAGAATVSVGGAATGVAVGDEVSHAANRESITKNASKVESLPFILFPPRLG